MAEKQQQDDAVKGRIMALLQKGYSSGQLINDFNFDERTVDGAIRNFRDIR